jgi:hypothetical protein
VKRHLQVRLPNSCLLFRRIFTTLSARGMWRRRATCFVKAPKSIVVSVVYFFQLMVHIRCQFGWRKLSSDANKAAHYSNNPEVYGVLIDFGWDVNEYIGYVGDALMWVNGTTVPDMGQGPRVLPRPHQILSFTLNRLIIICSQNFASSRHLTYSSSDFTHDDLVLLVQHIIRLYALLGWGWSMRWRCFDKV